MTTEVKTDKPKFKEDLSRMAGAYGEAMIGKLKQMHVYISGLKGLGLETAKNLVLAGPHSVTVQDDDKAQTHDLGTNFYLTPAHVGKPIGECIIETLAELNPNVNVSLHKGPIDTKYLNHFNVVCFTDRTPANKLIEYNEFCRNRTKVVKDKAGHDQTVPDPIVFVYGSLDGASASLFSDFGPKFWTFDPDGLPEKTIVIDHISNAKNGVVTVDGDRSLLLAGDVIKLEEVRGMSDNVAKKDGHHDPIKTDEVIADINSTFIVGELKHTVPYTDAKGNKKTKVVTDPKRFIIGDTTKLGEYKGGGIGTTVKQGVWKTFKSFKESLINPNFIGGYTDFTKMGREASLHFARCALFRFREEKHAWPKLHDAADTDHIVALAQKTLAHHKELVEKKTHEALVAESLDESIVRKVALYARAELTALAALMGGVLAQEITKQTGKFTPMDGWFHFDAFELLDDKVPADAAPVGSRYDHQIAIFGRKWQEKAHAQKLFLVGSGALGCEYLKAIAMIGLGTHGKISVTDDDRIELSNLSRQFLFRREHVGKSKSTSAAEAVKKMNPDLAKTLKAYEIRVEPKTEDTFDDDFWESLDFVLNALDNNIARRYVDTQCVMHYKPLFESGTLGTQANTVICLPGKTPSYSEGAVAGENQGIAQCTLRNFPFLDLHCIEWAREMFNDLFIHGPDAQNSFLEDKAKFYKKLENSPLEERGTLEKVKRWLDLSKAPSFELCCQLAIDQFTNFYRDGINDLTNNFPEDARVKDGSTGADLGPFWHGHKRFPRAAPFDPKNDKHLDYVFAAANILASVFLVPEQLDREKVREVAAKIPVKSYKFSGAKIKLDEDKKGGEQKAAPEPESVSDDDKVVVADLKKYLDGLDLKGYKKLKAADFEKDDDTNHHIDWIAAATNMRCFNYHIKETTRANCRMVAGRIIPAIATTTAMITGFVQLEVYKYIKGVVLEAHRAATVNLGTNVFCVELLPDPRRKKTGLDPESYMQCTAIPEGFTVWDKVVIKKPGLTLAEFMDEFSNVHHGAKITTLTSTNGKILYNDFSDKKQMDENKATKLVDLYVAREGPVHPAGRNYIVLVAAGVEDKEGNSAVCPLVVYHFK